MANAIKILEEQNSEYGVSDIATKSHLNNHLRKNLVTSKKG